MPTACWSAGTVSFGLNASEENVEMIRRLQEAYARHLIPVTDVIHGKSRGPRRRQRRAGFEGIDEVPAITPSRAPGTRIQCTVAACWRKTGGLAVLLAALFVAQPSSAQKLYSYEPLMMDPYSTIYVNDGSCSAGKVLKVQGAPRNQRRKKSCVPMSDLQVVRAPAAAKIASELCAQTARGRGRSSAAPRALLHGQGCRLPSYPR